MHGRKGMRPRRAAGKIRPMNLAALALERPTPCSTDRTGTQSLARGIKLMRLIAARPQFGWRLLDLAAAAGQDKATVHRMLACMVDERLVEQRASDRHYLPGPLMFELGFALPDRVHWERRAEATVHSVSRRLAGIALFMLRSGNEYVCTVRAGTLHLSGLMVYPGTRRPLFTSVGGIAILQTLPADEVRQILVDNVAQEIKRRGTTRLEALQKMRERSDRHGFGVNLGDVVPGVHAFGVPVCDSAGAAMAALCIIGTAELYPEDRVDEIKHALEAGAAAIAAEAHKFNM